MTDSARSWFDLPPTELARRAVARQLAQHPETVPLAPADGPPFEVPDVPADEQVDLAERIRAGLRRMDDEIASWVEDEPTPGRRPLSNVRTMAQPVDSDEWDIEGLARPRAIVVVGSAEGIGKSMMRKEIELRLGSGCGPLFGHFAIPRALTVATFEEENGDAEEWRRDEQVLAALLIEREAIADRLFRVSYPGLDLTRPLDQAYIRDELERIGADVAWFDTGGSMIGEEWGEPMKVAFRFLRSLEVTVFLNVHLVKPNRNGGHGPTHGSSMSDIMGQWPRQADAVCIVSDLGAGRVRMLVRKRVPPQELILAQKDGLWITVAEGGAAAARPKNDERVLLAISGGLTDPDSIRLALGSDKRPMAHRTFFDAVARLRKDRLIEADTPYRLTVAGAEAIE
jgi:hypothetical protein